MKSIIYCNGSDDGYKEQKLFSFRRKDDINIQDE